MTTDPSPPDNNGDEELAQMLKYLRLGNLLTHWDETLAKARVGQGTFRAQILAIWDSRCCVTSSTTLDAIRASHIKPWRDSNDNERLDPNNGLPLIATLDALFDAGLITFADDGKLVVSERIEDYEKELLGIVGRQLVRQPNDQTL